MPVLSRMPRATNSLFFTFHDEVSATWGLWGRLVHDRGTSTKGSRLLAGNVLAASTVRAAIARDRTRRGTGERFPVLVGWSEGGVRGRWSAKWARLSPAPLARIPPTTKVTKWDIRARIGIEPLRLAPRRDEHRGAAGALPIRESLTIRSGFDDHRRASGATAAASRGGSAGKPGLSSPPSWR